MKRIPLLLLPLLAMILSACPFVSNLPITMPMQKADKIVYGDWVILKADSSKGDEYTIEEHEESDLRYRIDGPDAIYEAWVSAVNDKWFLNICDPRSMESGYLLFRIDKMNFNSIELTPVAGRQKQHFADLQHIKEWITTHANENSFYDQSEQVKLIRMAS